MFLLATALAAPFPDLASTTQRMSCTAPPIARGSHPGAESFFSGAFRVDEAGTVTGVERKYLYANAAWKAKTSSAEDCVDRWNLTGEKVMPVKCPTCSFGIKVAVVIDKNGSSCEIRSNSDASRYTTTYNVTVKGDRFELTFASGKSIGAGKVEGETYSWIGEQACVWF